MDKILILGSSGMIGSSILRVLSNSENLEVFGTIRNDTLRKYFSKEVNKKIISNIDFEKNNDLIRVVNQVQPDVVINCVGITKHKQEVKDPLKVITINALMPHYLNEYCQIAVARLIHISTDCVFSGDSGMYLESDITDASDVYGRSKAMGEVINSPNSITLRTSTIGHELNTNYGLLNWFLTQEKQCLGYSKAVFSGLPTVILAQVIRDYVIPNSNLSGLYHVSASPINKLDLLRVISETYFKKINIVEDKKLIIDRSLNSEKFKKETGFIAPEWRSMISTMYKYK